LGARVRFSDAEKGATSTIDMLTAPMMKAARSSVRMAVSSMGRSGGNAGQLSLHLVAVDAKGNVYTGGVE